MDEVKTHTNWGQGTAGAGVLALGAIELGKGIIEACRGRGAADAAAQAANTTVAMQLAEAHSKIAMMENNADTRRQLTEVLYALDKRVQALETAAPLREEIMCGKIDKVATLAQGGIASLEAQVMGLGRRIDEITKVSIPLEKICPAAMPRYNNWVPPVVTDTTKKAA